MTLASMERVEAFVAEAGATFWIEHQFALFQGLDKAPAYYQLARRNYLPAPDAARRGSSTISAHFLDPGVPYLYSMKMARSGVCASS